MANLVVTSNDNFIKVETGIYAAMGYPEIMVFNKGTIEEALTEESVVKILVGSIRNNKTWYVIPSNGTIHSNKKHHTLIVDSVNGVEPSSRDNLLDLIFEL